MKPKFRISALSTVMIYAGVLATGSLQAQTTYYWDSNNGTAGFGAANGTWAAPTAGTTTAGWSTDSTGATVVNGNSVTTSLLDSVNFGTNLEGYTGGRTITISGTVDVGNITFGSASGAVTLSGGTAINLAAISEITVNNATSTISTQLTGGGTSLTKAGNGILILNNNSNNYTGKTVVNGGVLQIGTGFSTGNLSVPGGYTSNPVTGSNLELNGGIVSYYFDFNRSLGTGDGQIQITGGVSGFTQKQGDRTNLTFGTAATSVVWGSTVFNPTVLVLNDDAAGPANTITFNNLLNLDGANRTIATNSATRGAIMNNVISNGGVSPAGLIKTGVGNLSLNATNTYNGATLISDGTLTIGNGGTTGALATSSVITTDATLAFNRTNTLTQGTNFADGILGTGGVTQVGTGTTILSGTNSYAGNTRGNAGILLATVATALPGYNTAGKVIFNGGTIGARIGGSDWTTGEVDTLLSSATKTSGALGIDTTNGDLAQWTTFLGGAGNLGALGLTKIGANVLTLDQANTYTGATRVNGGTLTAGIETVTGVSGAFGVNSAVTMDNVAGASLNLAGFNTQIGSLAGGGTTGGGVALGGATLTTGANNVTNLTYGGVISGTGTSNLVKIGTGFFTLSGNNTYAGTTTVNGGVLDFAGGTLGFGGGSGRNITVAEGAGVKRNTLDNAFLNRIVNTTDEITVMTGATSNNLDFSSNTGAILPNAFLGNYATNGAKAEYSGIITPGSNGYKLGGRGSNGLLGIRSVLSGANTLTVGGTGASGIRVNLVAANTHTGETVINTGAKLTIGNNLALQNSALNVGATGGNFALAAGTNGGRIAGETASASPTFGGLIGSRNLSSVFTNGGGNNESNLTANLVTGFTLNVADGNTFTYSGAIGGFGAGTTNNNGGGTGGNSTLTKTGLGTQILGGTNTYTGATTVSAGSLLINGSTSTSSAVAVNAGTLGGTGTIGGSVSVADGATLSPGASIESLASGALTMASGSNFAYEAADNSSTGADLLAVNGIISLTGVNLNFDLATLAALGSGAWGVGDKLTLISYTGTGVTSGFVGYDDDTNYSFGANVWTFNYDDTVAGGNYDADAIAAGQTNFVTLTAFTVIPEPSVTLLGALGALMLLRRRR